MEHIVMKGNFYDVMQDRECIVFERTRDTEQRIHEPCACLSSVFILSSTNHHVDLFATYTYGCAFNCWNFLSPAARKNNNTAKFFVSLKKNNSEGFSGTP